MKGFRTLVILWVTAVLAPKVLAVTGIELTEQQKLEVVAYIMAGVGTVMRAVTSTPMFKKIAAAITPEKEETK